MKTLSKLFTFFFILHLTQSLQSKTWKTVSDGFWNNSNIWENGIVPSLLSTDTFIIRNYVAISDNIFFDAGELVQIESSGGICGHKKLTVNQGAKLIKYGILELDTLSIPGGQVSCFAPGRVILTKYGIISNGGSFTLNGCSLNVGPWFSCSLPEYSFTGVDETSEHSFNLFPNPTSGEAFIDIGNNVTANVKLTISTYSGLHIMTQSVDSYNGKIKVDLFGLSPSLYIVELKRGKNIYHFKLIKQ